MYHFTNHKTRTLMLFFTLLILVVVSVGCGQQNPPKAPTPNSSTSQTTPSTVAPTTSEQPQASSTPQTVTPATPSTPSQSTPGTTAPSKPTPQPTPQPTPAPKTQPNAAASQGQTLFTQQCQVCHGDKGSGGLKVLNGGLANYSSQAALATFIQTSMPQGNAHLSAAQASDLAAYLFFINHR